LPTKVGIFNENLGSEMKFLGLLSFRLGSEPQFLGSPPNSFRLFTYFFRSLSQNF